MNFKPTIATFALLLLAGAALAAPATKDATPAPGADKSQVGPGPVGEGGPQAVRPGQRMAEELGLTEEQQAKMEDLRRKNMEETMKLRTERGKLMRELADLVKSNAKDAELTAKLEALKANLKSVMDQQERHAEAVRAILTPGQQARLVLMMDQRGLRQWRNNNRPEGGPEGER